MSDFEGRGKGFGGNGGSDEPPIDLDALRKKFEGVKNKMGKWKFPGPALILIIIAAAWVISGFYKVNPDEQGVIRRFGEFIEPLQGPGLHWRIPWPVEQVDKVKVTKIYSIEVGFRTVDPGPPTRYQDVADESEMLTGDENIVAADFIVQYLIIDPVKYLFMISRPDNTLKEAAESAMREVVGERKIDDVLTEHKAEIQADVFKVMQAMLDEWHTGLRVQEVKLQDVTPPGPVDPAFKDVASAREDKDRIVKQADGYRNDLLPKASGEAAKMLNEAQAYAEAKIKRAEGEADRFRKLYTEYVSAREITRRRLYIEALEDVLSGAEKIVLEGSAQKNLLPYLPVRRETRAAQ